MSAVIAVLLVVVCDPDLIHCAPAKAWERLWETVELCRLDQPRIENDVRARVGDEKTVMSTCRLYLDEGHRFRRSLLAKTPSPSDQFLF